MNNNRKLAKNGLALMLVSLVFAFAETAYFGFNMLPETKAEMVCGGIALLIGSMGSAMFLLAIFFEAGDQVTKIKKGDHE